MLPFKGEHVENVVAIFQQNDTVAKDDALNAARKPRQTRIAGVWESAQLFCLSWRKGAATGQLFLNARRQALKIIAREAAVQNFAITIAKTVSIVTRPALMAVIVVIIVIVM